MEYSATIEENISEEFKIESNSEEEALEIVERLYKQEKLILEPGILSVEFKNIKLN